MTTTQRPAWLKQHPMRTERCLPASPRLSCRDPIDLHLPCLASYKAPSSRHIPNRAQLLALPETAAIFVDLQVPVELKMGDKTKTSWPEVEGLPAAAAKHKILADRPEVHVVVLPVGSVVTTDYDIKRVRVFINRAGNVAEVPKVG
ncbi:hypothetical protein GQ55_3G306900 [Panicum hallii var. hallii]|uniref:Uncharacterized protein n=1 Tax=Panicum hallii var. hallii TaxID=1504633 RepID=A0A2T7EF22_9POAL|nr:hypothetical protein GQ55_3G306900 [Panicum hallii var. hallii]